MGLQEPCSLFLAIEPCYFLLVVDYLLLAMQQCIKDSFDKHNWLFKGQLCLSNELISSTLINEKRSN